MKQFIFSLVGGGTITFLLFALAGRSGPSVVTEVLIIPFIIVSSFLTKNRAVGEFLYYGLQVIVWSFITYILLNWRSNSRRRSRQKDDL
jgi:hypothetical protein